MMLKQLFINNNGQVLDFMQLSNCTPAKEINIQGIHYICLRESVFIKPFSILTHSHEMLLFCFLCFYHWILLFRVFLIKFPLSINSNWSSFLVQHSFLSLCFEPFIRILFYLLTQFQCSCCCFFFHYFILSFITAFHLFLEFVFGFFAHIKFNIQVNRIVRCWFPIFRLFSNEIYTSKMYTDSLKIAM